MQHAGLCYIIRKKRDIIFKSISFNLLTYILRPVVCTSCVIIIILGNLPYLFLTWNSKVNKFLILEAFFHRNTKLLGLDRQFGQINFGAFGVFSVNLSVPILVLWVPCPCFPLINHYSYKKLSLYIQIPNIYLGLGFEFEFGMQRIRELAIVCP